MEQAAAPSRGWSLQVMLILFAFGLTLLAWTSGISAISSMAEREAKRLHDLELKEVAVLLLGLSAHEIDEIGPNASIEARVANGRADTIDAMGENYRYQVWSNDGKLHLTNFGDAKTGPLATLGVGGFGWRDMDGEQWRTYSLLDLATQHQIHVAERVQLRQWDLALWDPRQLMTLLVSLAVVLVPALLILRRMTWPLRQFAQALRERSPSNLQAVHIQHAPRELGSVVSALNLLFARTAEAFRREVEFTALAAHELRTPLATLHVLADSLGRTDSEEARKRLLADLIASADRCSRLQDQLLTLSRLDALGAVEAQTQVEITDVIMDVVQEIQPEARRRRMKVVSNLDGSAMYGHRFGVATLVRNLVGNAVRYTPDGGRVEIRTSAEGPTLILQIDDSGPGIPKEHRSKVFERFERLHRDGSTGVGLGLSIVRTVARLHGAEVVLDDSPLGGLRVVVRFVDLLVKPARDDAIGRLTLSGA